MALSLSDVALLHHGPTMSLTLEQGQILCVVGPAASGKSKLLRILSGQDAPDRGKVKTAPKVAIPDLCNRKLRPQDLSHNRWANNAVHATEVLSRLGLWSVRQKFIVD